MTYTKSQTLTGKMMRTLTLNKFDHDYMLNSHYNVSTHKLCSTYISVGSIILPNCAPCLIHHTKECGILVCL